MALVVKDRVRETSLTAGTGTIVLGGAVSGFQTFAAIGNGNTTYYCITDPITGDWEVGIGTYTASGTTLSRDTVLSNSAGTTAKINFAANTKDVFCTYPSERAVYVEGSSITPGVTATLPVSSGGTGLTSGTSGGVPYYSSSSTIASSNALTANALMVGGGAGSAPSTITTGTGVATALGVNTGSAGAFVVNGGALGTPSSGTVTNLTGTASININGTVGATTPNTGDFTSITSTSASGILTRQAATQDGVQLLGRAGGTSSYEVVLTPTTLSADRTLTLPDASGTILQTGTTVTVPQGGTGITSGTSGGVPYFSSGTTIASSSALAANALVLGGGAGAAPTTTTTGTGVVTAVGNAVNNSGGLVTQSGTLAASALLLGGGASTAISSTTTGTGVVTALGVNVGTAGAFVVNGGALGTPSSGTVTNLTGTASININGTVGATTPTTGAFTTISASGNVTLSGGTANGVLYLDGSKIVTSGTALAYNSTTNELTAGATVVSNGIMVNSKTVATNYTIASGYNGLSAGPVTVNSGITVTVSSGSVWTVV